MQALPLILIAILAATSTLAHEWYPTSCCSDRDCAAIPFSTVKVSPEGYTLDSGEFIPHDRARDSQDDHYHVCRSGGQKDGRILGQTDTKGTCFFVPRGGSV